MPAAEAQEMFHLARLLHVAVSFWCLDFGEAWFDLHQRGGRGGFRQCLSASVQCNTSVMGSRCRLEQEKPGTV